MHGVVTGTMKTGKGYLTFLWVLIIGIPLFHYGVLRRPFAWSDLRPFAARLIAITIIIAVAFLWTTFAKKGRPETTEKDEESQHHPGA